MNLRILKTLSSVMATVFVFVLSAWLTTTPAQADPNNPPQIQPGFPVPLSGGRPYSYLPTAIGVADLDNSGRRKIILATQSLNGSNLGCAGKVYVYNSNGTLRWEANLPSPPGMGAGMGDLNGDSVKDVVIGYGPLFTGCTGPGGVVWDPLESTCRHASLSIL